MLNADKLCEIACTSGENENVTKLEKMMTEAAEQGKFYTIIYEGKCCSTETALVVRDKFGSAAYRTLLRQRIVVVGDIPTLDKGKIYAGWGYQTKAELWADIRNDEGLGEKET